MCSTSSRAWAPRPARRWRRTLTWPGSAFTGSVATGRQVAAAAGAQLTPVSLELGGKSPLLVFADADLDLAVATAVGQYDNAGQVCLAGTRLLVDEAVAAEFTERFLAGAAALRQGDPRDDATDVGPSITRAHLERVDGFVQRAMAAGARPLLGGGPSTRPRRPVLPADAAGRRRARLGDPDRGGVRPGADAADVRHRGRGGRAGQQHPLRAGGDVFTGDEQRAERVSARLGAGTVWVNCFFVRDLRAPFGGTGQSGIGREGGTWSFDFYSDVKNTVYARPATRMAPRVAPVGAAGERHG